MCVHVCILYMYMCVHVCILYMYMCVHVCILYMYMYVSECTGLYTEILPRRGEFGVWTKEGEGGGSSMVSCEVLHSRGAGRE